MFNSVAFDVVIGLIFIYLLYSLLVTIIAEIIATKLGLRARNLKEAIDRMLNDEKDVVFSGKWYEAFWQWLWDKICRLWDSCRLMKNPKNPVITNFYNHPEIKYLGSSGVFKNPSSFRAASFSKTLLYLLCNNGPADPSKIDANLRTATTVLGPETAKYVLSIWDDSQKDVIKFKAHLESWFDRTMEQATEWYKRKIQLVLLILGFVMASIFNADTITIVHKLSTDKDAREQMVKMASAYVQNHPERPADISKSLDSAGARDYKEKMDSLVAVKKKLDVDISAANSILGAGSWLPDSVLAATDKAGTKTTFTPAIDETLLDANKFVKPLKGQSKNFHFTGCDKRSYFLSMIGKHFWGFLLTAIAISLGAPFWFDLLNKMIRLRTSAKQDTDSSAAASADAVSPLNRVG